MKTIVQQTDQMSHRDAHASPGDRTTLVVKQLLSTWINSICDGTVTLAFNGYGTAPTGAPTVISVASVVGAVDSVDCSTVCSNSTTLC